MLEQEQTREGTIRRGRMVGKVFSTCVAPRPTPVCLTRVTATIRIQVVQILHTSHGLLVSLAIAGHIVFPVEVPWRRGELWNWHFDVDGLELRSGGRRRGQLMA